MLIKLLTLFCLFACSVAWIPPQRCAQGYKHPRNWTATGTRNINLVSSIDEFAAKQKQALKERYKNYEFYGVPIRAVADDEYLLQIEIHAPYHCKFYTYNPRLLASVVCCNATCKLTHTVSTFDTYTASEGYNWGVKGSSKLSIPHIFEVGGEVSSTESYTCTFSKGRTTTDTVECSDSSRENGHLQLYNVKSDMVCDFGGIKLVRHFRNGEYGVSRLAEDFTIEEIRQLEASAQVVLEYHGSLGINWFMMDVDKVSEVLFQKFLNKFPLYNPFTDLILVEPNYVDLNIRVLYFKQASTVPQYRSIVPFTNESGDSVFQYACIREQI